LSAGAPRAKSMDALAEAVTVLQASRKVDEDK
jgi:hypothetical protein